MATQAAKVKRPRLARPPEAISISVEDLLAYVGDGKVRVPRFQRKMRWGRGERVALFDSILRGYPVGTLLLWKRPAHQGTVQIGEVSFEAEARSDALWVVDGQQRITTLVEALLRPGQPSESALHFDINDEGFTWKRLPSSGQLHAARTPGLPAHLVPTSVLLDSARLMAWILDRDPPLDADARAQVLEVGKRLREYRLPAYIVETPDEAVLRVIFERVNRSGARMTDAEVFHALYASEQEQSSLADVAAAVASTGWGKLGDKEVLRTLLAIEGLPIDKGLPNDLDRARMTRAVGRTSRALVEAAAFLAERAAVPHLAFNGYALPLVVLGRFFDAFPSPSPRSLTLLRRWLWRGLSGLHLAGAVVDLRRHLGVVVHGEEHETVQRLLALTPEAASDAVYELSPVSLGTARTKIQCCALAALEPRDLRDGTRCAVGALATSGAGAPLASIGDGDDLALRLLHPPITPTELAVSIAECDDLSILDSHAIPVAARDALRRGDLSGFRALRAQALRAWLERFFARMAEWGADDSPPLAALAPAEDDDASGSPADAPEAA